MTGIAIEPISKILIIGLDDAMFEMTRFAWSGEKTTVLYHAEKIVDGIVALTSGKYHLVSIVLPPDKDERLYFISQIKIIRDMTAAPISIMTHDPYDTVLKVKVIDAGADDIQVCPPTMEEAIATAKAMIRRYRDLNNKEERPVTVICSDNIMISLEHRKVFIQGHEVELLPKEFDILRLLTSNQGRVFSHKQIINEVWGDDYIYETKHTLWSQINSLRKKIQIIPGLPNFIKTKRGVGYSFDP